MDIAGSARPGRATAHAVSGPGGSPRGTTGAPLPFKRVLVTGAAGLIGRAVTWHLANHGVPVTGLVLSDPGDLAADRLVVGSAGDRASVEDALDGADAVIHLAALPAPHLGTPEEVFCGNTSATFSVLDAAGAAGIGNAVIASSVNYLGYLFSPVRGQTFASLPVDATTPSVAADPYSLSKVVDEQIAAAMHRRHGIDVVCLRFPFVGGLGEVPGLDGRLPARAAQLGADPGAGASDLWLYLETRDAAAAAVAALSPSAAGAHAVYVAAPETFVPHATADLIAAFHPGATLTRPLPGRTAPVDLEPARRLFGFHSRHLLELPTRPLPA
ncbi:NAD-dependent epimerase/dehydratase family protein [Phytomonospora endophytica]|uniref:Nucleoside-diphosphate-sugar epimerase n=1 Tax=Phytomonospora endophytica TaxID=714109 RepID=A0A841FF07_9ACTN|nr:NAD(P)-dependent oxidoreductase [Phytomonospora endophytica]MBB6035891.1 nucleoside-diphosphate-sugar epimerase [Phytomonospora endophytica]GIG71113.1 NAD-dependent epimerase [Phytomonospora endophytica]